MARTADPEKAREWQRRLARFEASELSIARFCQREQVSPASFYQWRRRLRQKSTADDATPAAGASGFMPVRVVGATAVVTVRLPGGTELEVPGGDPQLLQMAIRTIAQLDAERAAGGQPC